MSSTFSIRTETPKLKPRSSSAGQLSHPPNYGQVGYPVKYSSRSCHHGRDACVSPRYSYEPSMRGRLCPSLTSSGACGDMRRCPYSHTVDETRIYNPNFKTKLCEFAANGFCAKANECRYAHSFSELGPLAREEVSIGRNVSSVSTVDVSTQNHSCGSETDELSPITSGSPTTRVCYEAPEEQRSVVPRRQKRLARKPRVYAVPPSYHYLEHLDQMRVPPMSYLPYYYGPQMMYSMMSSPNVVYED